jgi:hypothetical protein
MSISVSSVLGKGYKYEVTGEDEEVVLVIHSKEPINKTVRMRLREMIADDQGLPIEFTGVFHIVTEEGPVDPEHP